MTTFEEMLKAWQAQNAKFEDVALLSENLVQQDSLRRIRTPMSGLKRSLAFETGFSALGMLILGNFIALHRTEFRFVWPAALLDLWFLATLTTTIHQWVAAANVDYDQPVAKVQGQLTSLRIIRLRAFRWIFLAGQVAWWIPFVITALRMLGVDAYRYVTPPFLAINLLAGIAVIPFALVIAKRMRFTSHRPWYERLSDVIAGRSLSEAQRQANVLANFE